MLKSSFTFLLLVILIPAFSQQYKCDDILRKADSILIAELGQRIFSEYYTYDVSSYYQYRNKRGKTNYAILKKGKNTRQDFVKMSLRFNFCLNKFNHYCNMTIVNFDSSLNLHDTLKTEFIPQYVWLNDKCNFLHEKVILSIARENFKVAGKKIFTDFSYNFPRKMYLWTVTNSITDNEYREGEKEIVQINALTGEVVNYEKGLQVIVK